VSGRIRAVGLVAVIQWGRCKAVGEVYRLIVFTEIGFADGAIGAVELIAAQWWGSVMEVYRLVFCLEVALVGSGMSAARWEFGGTKVHRLVMA
jgi:hypothetical protein